MNLLVTTPELGSHTVTTKELSGSNPPDPESTSIVPPPVKAEVVRYQRERW